MSRLTVSGAAVSRRSAAPPPSVNQYVTADARRLEEILAAIGRPVDVTITSPPYWDVKDYGGRRRQVGFGQTRAAFLDDLSAVCETIWRHTRATGSLWLIVNTIKKARQLDLFPFELAGRLRANARAPWNLEDVLIWHKTHTLPWSHGAELPDHFEYIFCFGKSEAFKLNIDAVRQINGLAKWWVRYPERYHPHGRAPSNVWEIPIPTQGTWGDGNVVHMCPLPVQLPEQIIALAAPSKGLVLDPFAGAGTTLIAARNQGRKWLGVDTNSAFRRMFERRLATEPKPDRRHAKKPLAATNLKLRQLKYALQLFKRLGSTSRVSARQIPFVLVIAGDRRRSPQPFWIEDCRIVFAVRAPPSTARRLRLAAADICSRPPLSKYQIATVVEFVAEATVRRRYGSRRLHYYSGGRFWVAQGRETVAEILDRESPGGFPMLASDVSVRENGTRWGEL
jgi:DNA modification methylase